MKSASIAATNSPILWDLTCVLWLMAPTLSNKLSQGIFNYEDSRLGNGGLFELAWPTHVDRLGTVTWRMSFSPRAWFQHSDQLAL